MKKLTTTQRLLVLRPGTTFLDKDDNSWTVLSRENLGTHLSTHVPCIQEGAHQITWKPEREEVQVEHEFLDFSDLPRGAYFMWVDPGAFPATILQKMTSNKLTYVQSGLPNSDHWDPSNGSVYEVTRKELTAPVYRIHPTWHFVDHTEPLLEFERNEDVEPCKS